MKESIVQGEPGGVERLVERYWFLVRRRGFRPDGAPVSSADPAATLVIRDGACVVVSVEATAMGWPEGTLLFRFRSEVTPCVACVDRAVEVARHRTDGRLTPGDVREMLRCAVNRCEAEEHARLPAEGRDTEPPPPPLPVAEQRQPNALWLVL